MYSGASEETAEETLICPETGEFYVTWDPLDGSSIVDSNGAIGSIFGIWPRTETGLLGMRGGDQIGALLCV